MPFVDKLETTDFEKMSKEEVVRVVKMCINVMKSHNELIDRLEESVRLLKETIKTKDRLFELQQNNKKPDVEERRLGHLC